MLTELRAAVPMVREHARPIRSLRAEVADELARPKLDAATLTPKERRALLAALRRPQRQVPES